MACFASSLSTSEDFPMEFWETAGIDEKYRPTNQAFLSEKTINKTIEKIGRYVSVFDPGEESVIFVLHLVC